MPIQTVEEAAQSRWPLTDKLTPSDRSLFEMWHRMFKDGAAWQKEQGIEWINIENQTPPLSFQCLVYDPSAIVKCYTAFYMPLPTTENAGCFTNGNTPCFNVTHFAYINLPKTDKL